MKKKTENENKKLTIFEYEDKFVEKESYKNAQYILGAVLVVCAVFLFKCLLDIALAAAKLNIYFGYGVGVICLIIYVVFFILPIAKVLKTKSFKVDVTKFSAAKAKRFNKELRKSIAEKFVEYHHTVENGSWYRSEQIGAIEIALSSKNDAELKTALTRIYAEDINKTAKDMILKASLKSGLYSAVSQTDKIDATLVLVVNLQLIKDIVFLYGYRPTYPKLVKIYRAVLINSLVAYGLGNVKIGNGVVKTMGDMVKSVPLLGSAISVLVDSSVQGLSNATLTAIMGYNAIKIMAKEYRLQDILDNIEIADDDDIKETCLEVAGELKKSNVKKPLSKVKVTA